MTPEPSAEAAPGPAIRAIIRRPLALALAAGGLSALLNLAGAIFIIMLFERILPERSLTSLGIASAMVMAAYVAQAVLRQIALRACEHAGIRLLDALEGPFIAAQLRAGELHGEAEAQALRDLYTLARLLRGRAVITAIELACASVFLVFLAKISPYLALFALLSLGLLALIVRMGIRRRKETDRSDFLPAGTLLGRRRGDLPSATAVEADGYATAIAARRRNERDNQTADTRSDGWLRTASLVLKNLTHAGILATGALLIMLDQIAVGGLLASGMLMMRIFGPARALVDDFASLQAGWKAFRRLDALPARAILGINNPSAKPGLAVDFPRDAQRRPDAPVAFSLAGGEVALITGPSGSGKSRILAAIAGEIAPRGATIRWGDAPIDQAGAKAGTPLVGYLPQEMVFVAGTVLETIRRFDTRVDREAVFALCRQLGVHADIMALESKYRTPVPAGGRGLPFQLLRKVALVRALATKPPLLVLDEPLLGLAPDGRERVLATVRLAASAGAAIVIASSEAVDGLPEGPRITLPGRPAN